MVAVSFGSYASALFTDENKVWAKVFAALIIILMTAVNIVGSTLRQMWPDQATLQDRSARTALPNWLWTHPAIGRSQRFPRPERLDGLAEFERVILALR